MNDPVPRTRKKILNDYDNDKNTEISQLLRNVVQENEKHLKNVKVKKKKKKEEETILENLRNSSDINKNPDSTIDANTYNPSNDDAVHSKIRDGDKTLILENEVTKKKKKHRNVRNQEIDNNVDTDFSNNPVNVDTKSGGDNESSEIKKKKKRKKPKVLNQDKEINTENVMPQEEQQPDNDPCPDEGYSLAITIHKTDQLKVDFFILHPSVRVHIINISDENYFKKQHIDRAVTFYNETENGKIDYVLPIMTEKYDFRENRSFVPKWEERLIFNENFNWFLTSDCIIFFEIIDFVSMASASNRFTAAGQERGWHRIAWAFLRLCGANNALNAFRKIRLQLYKPLVLRSKSKVPDVFLWWKSGRRIRYPASLYVTVDKLKLPNDVPTSGRSKYAIQKEQGNTALKELDGLDVNKLRGTAKSIPILWSRVPGQICHVPNFLDLTLPSAKGGCYTLKFSTNGLNLACACRESGNYPILIYELPGGKFRGQFEGHFGLVYNISWSHNSALLISASNDCTARIWNVENMCQNPVKVLPHPTFVYCASFHPRVTSVVVTGCYDHILRIWSLSNSESTTGILVQELEPHFSYINSISFDENGDLLYSVDNFGLIRIWNAYVTEKPSNEGVFRDWSRKEELKIDEINGTTVNRIKVHPTGRKLLINTRDNKLRLIDLRLKKVTQRYLGSLNFRDQIGCTFSPCGTFVFSGSEDSAAYVWNADTGDRVAMYTDLNYSKPVCDVDYHPYDHFVAFCSFGENHPILIYKYDHKVAKGDTTTVEKLTMRKTKQGRPKSPLIVPTVNTDTEDDGKLLTARSKSILMKEELESSAVSRWNKIHKKLDAVSQFTNRKSQFNSDVESFQGLDSLTTLGSTFDAYQSGLLGTGNSQMVYADVHQSTEWKPAFAKVTKRGALRNAFSPELNLNLTKGGKAEFTVHTINNKQEEQVIALYDYQAQRSDELSFQKGDRINILYKDTQNWWMGELNKMQGFFPSNYVVSEHDNVNLDNASVINDEIDENLKHHAVGSSSDNFKIVTLPYNDIIDETIPQKQNRKKKNTKKKNMYSDESIA